MDRSWSSVIPKDLQLNMPTPLYLSKMLFTDVQLLLYSKKKTRTTTTANVVGYGSRSVENTQRRIIIIIKTFITRKFAEAANARSVDSTEEKRLQSLFEDVHCGVSIKHDTTGGTEKVTFLGQGTAKT